MWLIRRVPLSRACPGLTEQHLPARNSSQCQRPAAWKLAVFHLSPYRSAAMVYHDTEIRVRYPETDPGGFVHHSHYFVYFEIGRTELLRARGYTYKEMEASGLFFVVVKAEVRYIRPALYDDLLRLRTTVTNITAARIEHEYHLYRGTELLTEAKLTLCCVDEQGVPQRIPEWLKELK